MKECLFQDSGSKEQGVHVAEVGQNRWAIRAHKDYEWRVLVLVLGWVEEVDNQGAKRPLVVEVDKRRGQRAPVDKVAAASPVARMLWMDSCYPVDDYKDAFDTAFSQYA